MTSTPANICAPANLAIALRLQPTPPAGRVAELGSLIWLNSVKRTVLLLSESFHFSIRLLLPPPQVTEDGSHRLLDRVRDRNTFLRLSMLRCVSPLAPVCTVTKLSTEHGPTRRLA